MPLAYSYLRFSSPQQAAGDSIRRQTQSREAWLAVHPAVKLDTSLMMTDAGRSGLPADELGPATTSCRAGTRRTGRSSFASNPTTPTPGHGP